MSDIEFVFLFNAAAIAAEVVIIILEHKICKMCDKNTEENHEKP